MDDIKIKSLYAPKDPQHGMEKIFINLVSGKELASRICKELLQLNNKETYYSI